VENLPQLISLPFPTVFRSMVFNDIFITVVTSDKFSQISTILEYFLIFFWSWGDHKKTPQNLEGLIFNLFL